MKKKKHLRRSITQAFQFLLFNKRNSKNWSQYEFSRKCGFSRQYLSLVESGKRMPSLDFVFNFAEGFDMNVGELMQQLIDRIIFYKNLK